VMVKSGAGVTGDRAGNPFPTSSSYRFRHWERYQRSREGRVTATFAAVTLRHDNPSNISLNHIGLTENVRK